MRARSLSCVLVLATVALALGTASASAAIPFCTFGSGPGQCTGPEGVAVDTASGRVYVADFGNDRVNVFSEDGDFISSFGSSGSGPGQLENPTGLAVDDDPTSPAFHDVYVVDSNQRIQRFSPSGAFVLSFGSGSVHSRTNPVAVGPGGTVYFGEDNFKSGIEAIRRIDRFTPAGALLGSSDLPSTAFLQALAVDSSGHVYVNRIGTGGIVEKHELSEPSATLLDSFDVGANTTALAVDSTDRLYAAQLNGGLRAITKRDPSGNIVKRFGYGEIGFGLQGIAAGAGGELFGSEEFTGSPSPGNRVIRLPQPAPGALSCCLEATLGNTKATLKGGINPEGKAATYHFEYLTAADYAENGNSFSGANPATKTAESAAVGSDFELYPAEAQIGCATPEVPPQPSCLEPSTEYRYRLVAKNADGENFVEGQFTTKAPFEVLETFATEAGTDAVRLHASVNPLGILASAHLEYVDDATY
ncbi:MAG TPA: NHL repeat-containing protein, partial [Solirubrobacterales bacterium]|nr:NHL repeat-containing protein [Solirubrobacterales bacterium]